MVARRILTGAIRDVMRARPAPPTRRVSYDYYCRTQEARASGVTVAYALLVRRWLAPPSSISTSTGTKAGNRESLVPCRPVEPAYGSATCLHWLASTTRTRGAAGRVQLPTSLSNCPSLTAPPPGAFSRRVARSRSVRLNGFSSLIVACGELQCEPGVCEGGDS